MDGSKEQTVGLALLPLSSKGFCYTDEASSCISDYSSTEAMKIIIKSMRYLVKIWFTVFNSSWVTSYLYLSRRRFLGIAKQLTANTGLGVFARELNVIMILEKILNISSGGNLVIFSVNWENNFSRKLFHLPLLEMIYFIWNNFLGLCLEGENWLVLIYLSFGAVWISDSWKWATDSS